MHSHKHIFILLLFFFISLLSGCQKRQQQLSGDFQLVVIADAPLNTIVSLEFGENVLETTIKGKRAVFEGTIQEPIEAVVRINNYGDYSIFIDPAEMKLTVNGRNSYKLVGSVTEAMDKQYIAYLSPILDREILLKRQVLTLGQEKYRKEAIEADSLVHVSKITFASKFPESYYSLILLDQYYRFNYLGSINENIYKESKSIFDRMPSYVRDSTELGLKMKDTFREGDKYFSKRIIK